MPVQRLALFDIDGTLLHGGKLWRECMEGSFNELFPGTVFPKVSFSGKTDRQICMETLQGASLEIKNLNEVVDQVIEKYLARVKAAMTGGRSGEIKLLPGVLPLLQTLESNSEVRLGLLTGNVREGARLKLTAVGLSHFFGLGAFGDDHWDRYELPQLAVARARDIYGVAFQGKEVVIIGDTVHDVKCGRSINVRSIAVGTGRADLRPEILDAAPDFFFEDLTETKLILRAILDEI